MLQEMEAVGPLADRGRPGARRFRGRLRAIPHEDFNPGMRLLPGYDGGGLSVGEQGQEPPLFQVQQDRARGMTRPQRDIVHAEDLRGNHGGAGGAADHPQPRVATHQAAEVPTEPHPGRPTQGEAHGQETCRQPPGPPSPRRREARQSFSNDVAWACGTATEELMDAEPPRHPVTTPREIGQRPGVATVNLPGGGIARRASGCRLCRGEQEGDLGVPFVEVPGVQVERGRVG
jgi:hypothetical protein